MKTDSISPNSLSPGPLRVFLLNEFFYPDTQGGTATATANFCRALQDSGEVQVDVICGRHSYRDNGTKHPPTGEWNGIQIHRVAAPHWHRHSVKKRLLGNLLLTLAAAKKGLALRKADVALVTTSPITMPIAAMLLKRLRGIPYVYIVYDLDPDRSVALGQQGVDSRPVRMLRAHQKRWLSNAAAVISIGRCMSNTLIERYDLDPAKVHVVEVGANPDVVAPAGKDTKFRREHQLTDFVVLYSGNLGQYHDFDPLLDAAATLRDTHPEITFVIVGNGHKKKDVETRIKEGGLTNIRMFNFVPENELADLLASADAHFVTLESGMEGLCVPSKFYTYLASGRPVVGLVPAESEVAYVLEEAGCGVRVPPGDAAALATTLIKLAASPESLEAMGCRSRKVFESRFTTPNTAERLRQILLKVAQ